MNRRELEEFNVFIENMELVDPLSEGRSFTWFSLNGRAMSQLDRFFISDNLCGKVVIKSLVVEIFQTIILFGSRGMI